MGGQAVPLPGSAEAPPDRRPLGRREPLGTPAAPGGCPLGGIGLPPQTALSDGPPQANETQAHPVLCQTGKQRLPGQRPAGTVRAGGWPDSEPACPCRGCGPSSTGFAVRKRSPLRPGEVSAETRAPPLRMPPSGPTATQPAGGPELGLTGLGVTHSGWSSPAFETWGLDHSRVGLWAHTLT